MVEIHENDQNDTLFFTKSVQNQWNSMKIIENHRRIGMGHCQRKTACRINPLIRHAPFCRCHSGFGSPGRRGAGAHGLPARRHGDVGNRGYHEWKQFCPRRARGMPGAPPRATGPARRSSGGGGRFTKFPKNQDSGRSSFWCLM